MAIEIRICKPSDVPSLDWSTQQVYRDHFTKQFARQQTGEAIVYVAVDSGEIVGRIVVDLQYGDDDEVWVLGLEVRSSHLRQGLATSLMRVAETVARERNAIRLRLTVAKTNDVAQKLYERLDYRRVGEDMSPGVKDRQGRITVAGEPRWILERMLF